MSSEIRLRYENSVEEINAIEPMWNALQEHHMRITPELDRRPPSATWPTLVGCGAPSTSAVHPLARGPETFLVTAEDKSGQSGRGHAPITTTRL